MVLGHCLTLHQEVCPAAHSPLAVVAEWCPSGLLGSPLLWLLGEVQSEEICEQNPPVIENEARLTARRAEGKGAEEPKIYKATPRSPKPGHTGEWLHTWWRLCPGKTGWCGGETRCWSWTAWAASCIPLTSYSVSLSLFPYLLNAYRAWQVVRNWVNDTKG